MRHSTAIIILLLASAVFPLQMVSTQTSQNLRWGLEIGTRLNYTVTVTDPDGLSEESFYIMELASLPPIPDPLTNESTLMLPSFNQLDENGSGIEGPPMDLLLWMLPTGNWSLISDYYESLLSANVTIINNENSFGFVGFTAIGEGLMRIEIQCLKTDGALLISDRQMYSDGEVISSVIVERELSSSMTTTTSSSTTDTTTYQPLAIETILLIFASGGVIILIIVAVFLRKK